MGSLFREMSVHRKKAIAKESLPSKEKSRRPAREAAFDVRPVEGPEADAELVLVCKALGHPTRVRIVRLLRAREEGATVRELVTELASAQSTISEHLAVLRECGLVVANDESRKGAYINDVHHLRRLKALVGSL